MEKQIEHAPPVLAENEQQLQLDQDMSRWTRFGGIVMAGIRRGLNLEFEDDALVRNKERWNAALNGFVGIPEMAIGLARGAAGAVLDATHNLTDWWAYKSRLELIEQLAPQELRAELRQQPQEGRFGFFLRIKRAFAHRPSKPANTESLERRSYNWTFYPALGSVAVGLHGAWSSFTESADTDNFNLADVGHSAVGLAALGVALGLYQSGRRMDRIIDAAAAKGIPIKAGLRKHVANLREHAQIDAVTSGFVAAESLYHMAGSAGSVVSNLAVSGMASILAWKFRPTKQNMHTDVHAQHHEHTHEHSDDCGHLVSHHTSSWFEKLPGHKKALAAAGALGFSALAILGVDAAKDSWQGPETPAATATAPASPEIFATPETTPPEVIDTRQVFSDFCTTVGHGDSQWSVVESQLQQVIGERPNTTLTNAVTIFTARENLPEIPNPHDISPDNCITLPSDQVLKAMASASPQSDLGGLISELNQFSGWNQAMSAHPIYDQLERELQEVAR